MGQHYEPEDQWPDDELFEIDIEPLGLDDLLLEIRVLRAPVLQKCANLNFSKFRLGTTICCWGSMC